MIFPQHHRLDTKWLHIPVEVQHRELTSKMLLAFVAAEYGYSTIIGEQSTLYRNIEDLPKGIVYEHACGKSKPREDMFRSFHAAGHKIAASDDEAVSIYSVPEQWLAGRVSPEIFPLCDQYHVWGKVQAEIIAEHLGESMDRFQVTGSYRTDVWQPPVTNAHQKKADQIRAEYGPYILLPSNFSSSLDPRGPEYHLAKAKEYDEVTNEEEEKRYWEMITYKGRVCDAVIECLAEIIEAFPEHTLLIRPHPNESEGNWLRAIGELPRTRVIYEGEVTPWLLGADAIFHNGCTTALEARIMGKQPVTFMPIRDDRFDDIFLCQVGPMAETTDELIGYMKQVIEGVDLDYDRKDDLVSYVLNDADELSCDRIVRELEGFNLPNQKYTYKPAQYVHSLRERFRPEHLKTASVAARRRMSKNNATPKWVGVHLDEVMRLLSEFGTHLNRFENVGVADFKRRLFLVYPKN